MNRDGMWKCGSLFRACRFQTINGKIPMGMILNRRISYMNETDTYPLIDPKYGFSANLKPSQAQTIEFENIEAAKSGVYLPICTGRIFKQTGI